MSQDMKCAAWLACRGAAAADGAAHEQHGDGAGEARPPAAGHPADLPGAHAVLHILMVLTHVTDSK